jgi:tetratricopeptide (TPR) repeat protein
VKADIHDQNIEVIKLDKDVTNLYAIVDKLPNKNNINILFITGLESSFYKYEEAKTLVGWNSRQTHHYSWESVPPFLININQQRERFRDSFNICFIFLLPQFAIKYFIHRAPDFFDWRSGLFDFPLDSKTLEQEATRIIQERNDEEYVKLPDEEANKKILEIIDIIEHEIDDEQKAKLFFELGNLQGVRKNYEEAISSYDKAVEFKPDYYEAWNNRGISLANLGRYEEAISSYDKAVEFKPDDHKAWNNRGNSLRNLGRYEEAISSYDKALEIKPDYHQAWYNRGNFLRKLGRYEEAISSYDKALEIKPDDHDAWNNRGISLRNLGRYEEAISSYDKAVEFKPDLHLAWYNKACSYSLQGDIEPAIENLQTAINFNPDKYREMAKTESDFDAIRQDERFQALL